MLDKFLLVYIVNILIFSEAEEEHLQHVRLVLRHLLENSLFVKAEKCEFHITYAAFVGFIIQQGQLLPDPAKIQVLTEWPTSTTRKQLQQFLGFANFYRLLIQDYSRVAAPLTEPISTLRSFSWSERGEAVFSHLKVLFTTVSRHIQLQPGSLWWRYIPQT